MTVDRESDGPTHEQLMAFRRYERGAPDSQRLCRELISRVWKETRSVPQETPRNPKRDYPPFLVFKPEDAPNFALIEIIDSRRAGVTISLYGDQRQHDTDASRLQTAGRPRKGCMKIVVRHFNDVPSASEAMIRAFRLKKEKTGKPRP